MISLPMGYVVPTAKSSLCACEISSTSSSAAVESGCESEGSGCEPVRIRLAVGAGDDGNDGNDGNVGDDAEGENCADVIALASLFSR